MKQIRKCAMMMLALATLSVIMACGDDAINSITGAQKDGYFTLDGRKIQGTPSKRGIYIKDGKK